MRREGQTGVLRLAELYAPVAEALERSQQILADELISDQALVCDLTRHVRQFHGKRLRPALLLLAGRAAGELRPAHDVLAAVVELVHMSTLVHDDVLDEADIRRRAATVNRLWGDGQAVLLGDLLYSHAYHLCSSLESQFAARLVGQTAVAVCEGEMMQVANRGNYELTEAEYGEIIRRKTAALLDACCHLGAHYAGAPADAVQRLRIYGEAVGIAFQIVDDLLDVMGDEAEVGKSLGRDAYEGELTLPLIHFLRAAPPANRARLRAILGTEDPAGYRDIAVLLRTSDSVAYAQCVAAEHIARAQSALTGLPPSAARDSLNILAEFVIRRRQ